MTDKTSLPFVYFEECFMCQYTQLDDGMDIQNGAYHIEDDDGFIYHRCLDPTHPSIKPPFIPHLVQDFKSKMEKACLHTCHSCLTKIEDAVLKAETTQQLKAITCKQPEGSNHPHYIGLSATTNDNGLSATNDRLLSTTYGGTDGNHPAGNIKQRKTKPQWTYLFSLKGRNVYYSNKYDVDLIGGWYDIKTDN
jgi:hypothetical protein